MTPHPPSRAFRITATGQSPFSGSKRQRSEDVHDERMIVAGGKTAVDVLYAAAYLLPFPCWM
jgi:hypothetical protein